MVRLATGEDFNRKVECSAKALKPGYEVIVWNEEDGKTYIRKIVKVSLVGSQISLELEGLGKYTTYKKRTFFVLKKDNT